MGGLIAMNLYLHCKDLYKYIKHVYTLGSPHLGGRHKSGKDLLLLN